MSELGLRGSDLQIQVFKHGFRGSDLQIRVFKHGFRGRNLQIRVFQLDFRSNNLHVRGFNLEFQRGDPDVQTKKATRVGRLLYLCVVRLIHLKREVKIHKPADLHGLAVVHVGLELPLFDRVLSGCLEKAGA
jgi:hypothetical protein